MFCIILLFDVKVKTYSLSLLIINVEEIATFKSSQLFIAFYHVTYTSLYFYLVLYNDVFVRQRGHAPNGHTLIVVGKSAGTAWPAQAPRMRLNRLVSYS